MVATARAMLAFVYGDLLQLPVPGSSDIGKTVVSGMVKLRTTKPQVATEALDYSALFKYMANNPDFNRDLECGLPDLRLKTLALLAICCPWRPAELAELRCHDVYVTVRGEREQRMAEFVDNAVDINAALDCTAGALMRIVVPNSKGDRHKRGTEKRFSNADVKSNNDVAPIDTLVVWLWRVHKRDGKSGGMDNRHVFCSFESSSNRPADTALSADTISNCLASLATKATGRRITATGWRSGATNFMRSQGVPIDQLTLAGGWSTAQVPQSYYLRSQYPAAFSAAAVPPPASAASPTTRQPATSSSSSASTSVRATAAAATPAPPRAHATTSRPASPASSSSRSTTRPSSTSATRPGTRTSSRMRVSVANRDPNFVYSSDESGDETNG